MNTKLLSGNWLIGLISLHVFVTDAQPLPATILIDPKATYLLVNNDPAHAASPIYLNALGISSGDLLRLQTFGDFQNAPGSGYINGMTGVFSSNSVLLASNLLNRIPGAVAAGRSYVTPPTFSGGLSTDIPQDFGIQHFSIPNATNIEFTTNISIRVPPGAAYLFVSAKDTKFSDNTDNATNHFRILIDRGTEAVLSANRAASNTVDIAWNTDSNQWYQLQASPSPTAGWTNVGPPVVGTGAVIVATNFNFPGDTQFYRVKRVP